MSNLIHTWTRQTTVEPKTPRKRPKSRDLALIDRIVVSWQNHTGGMARAIFSAGIRKFLLGLAKSSEYS